MPDDEKKVKAKLSIRLLANDVVVAESDDPDLWQRILGRILGTTSIPLSGGETKGRHVDDDPLGHDEGDDEVANFASYIGVSRAELVGALSPSKEAPYLQLDFRTWEEFRKNYPSKGTNAVPKIVLPATALALWFSHLKQESPPTQAQTQKVLATINISEKNPTRSLKNCEWLQNRSGKISINPARASEAIALVRNYCCRTGPEA